MAKTVIGLMENMTQAQEVVRDLETSGFDRGSINLIGPQKGAGTTGGVHELREEKENATMEGAATGAGAGAAVGGLAGFVAGLTAITIPGIGPAVALGPLGAAIAGAGIGAVAGGGIGALMKMGVPERDAQFYLEGVKRGGILVAVSSPDDRVDMAANILQQHGAIDIDKRADQWKKEGWTGFRSETRRDDRYRSDLRSREGLAEREDITTERPVTGRSQGDETLNRPDVEMSRPDVATRRDVGLSERESEEISPRLRQDIYDKEGVSTHTLSERSMEGRPPAEGEPTRRAERELPMSEENVRMGRREVPENLTRVYGSAESVPIQEHVSLADERADTERDIERRVGMERRGSAERRVGGERHSMAATGLNAEDEDFRRHYRTMYGGKGDFETYRSAYHYADEDSEARRYEGRDFSEVEEDLHRSWERSHPAGSWAEFKEAIRYGWNKRRHI